MSEITIELVQAKQAELAAMIAALTTPAQTDKMLSLPEADIMLRPGERYAGALLDSNGFVESHLVLMAAKPDTKLDWNDAMEWAKSVGGELPSRRELALLLANCRDHMEKDDWQWSRDTHESDASDAWFCYFGNGNVYYDHKSYEGRARAVRLISVEQSNSCASGTRFVASLRG